MKTASTPGDRISVILPCYKMGRYIGEALASVGRQQYGHWEVLAVDDCGPEDGTEKAVLDFKAAFPQHRVEYLRQSVNGGVSRARNTALAAATGKWVAFLDPDDLWLDRHLSEAMLILQSQPEIDVVTSPVEAFSDDGSFVGQVFWQFDRWKIDRFPASLAYQNFLQPSATIVRKSLIDALGGFDVQPEIQHIEDYDLWIRLVEAGARFHFQTRVTSRYRRHPGGATSDAAKVSRLQRTLAAKHAGFFFEQQVWLLRRDAEDLALLNRKFNGPIMRLMLAPDRLLRYLRRRFGF